jgi:glycosyltransferase involved in cell wall biosynthesis
MLAPNEQPEGSGQVCERVVSHEFQPTPLVSVVIPCFRQAHFLPTAIDSCLAQTYTNIQVVVVNDGSDDDTEAVARSYGQRIEYVYRPNGGMSPARNTGLRHVKGTYVKFLDSDDHLHPEHIERQLRALDGSTSKVCSSSLRAYPDGFPEAYEDKEPIAGSLLPTLLRKEVWGNLQAFLFPTELVRSVGGFDESLGDAPAEDWEFACRLGLTDPAVVADHHAGAYYRIRTNSMARSTKKMATSIARILVKLHDQIRETGRRDWFGVELLGALQRAYSGLCHNGIDDPTLKKELNSRMRGLEALVGIGPISGRFRYLVKLLGYSRAEAVRCAYLKSKMRKKRPC